MTEKTEIIFSAFLESARLYKSTGMAKIVFHIDRKKISAVPGLWNQLTNLDIQEPDPLLTILITTASDVVKMAKMADPSLPTKKGNESTTGDLTDSQGKQSIHYIFHRDFFLNNTDFCGFVSQNTGEEVTQSNVVQVFKDYYQIESRTELTEYEVKQIIKEFHAWLKK